METPKLRYLTSVSTNTMLEYLHNRYLHYVISDTVEEARALAAKWWRIVKQNREIGYHKFEEGLRGKVIFTLFDMLTDVSPDYMTFGAGAIKVEKCEVMQLEDGKEYIIVLKSAAPNLTMLPPHNGVMHVTHDREMDVYYDRGGWNPLAPTSEKTGITLITSNIPIGINRKLGHEDILFWKETAKPQVTAKAWYEHFLEMELEFRGLKPFGTGHRGIYVSELGGRIYGLKNDESIVAGPITYRWCVATVLKDVAGNEFLQLPAFHDYIIPRQYSKADEETCHDFHTVF